MKKINLKGISEVLSEKELKNVMGGSSCNKESCKNSSCSHGFCANILYPGINGCIGKYCM